MRLTIFILTVVGCSFGLLGQGDTEVYLYDLKFGDGGIELTNKKNISNNEGYDNQPSFYDENTILFSSTRNGQTDIRAYDITTETTKWLTDTPVGGEYSPTRIPMSTSVSAIRLDTTGLQRLYRYDTTNGASTTLLNDAKVGYHLWYNSNILVNTVLVENRMDLAVSYPSENRTTIYQQKVGRNLLRIPKTDLISYVDKTGDGNMLKSMNVLSGATDTIINAYEMEDFAWLPNKTLLGGHENTILKYHPDKATNWSVAHTFSDLDIGNISRLTVSPDGTKLVLVAAARPEAIIDRQVATFNNRDLDGFVSCFSENVVVSNFPNDTLYVGRETMRKNYGRFYDNVKSSQVTVVNRIALGTTVIDEEIAVDNGVKTHQVAIYKVANGEIASMTFLFENGTTDSPVAIVQEQLDAYNDRNIDAFMETYTEDIALYNFPQTLTRQGQKKMRAGYQSFFSSTPDLHCDIKNRIVIGNRVIDLENVTANGQQFSAIAIYEVANGKISKVTFLR